LTSKDRLLEGTNKTYLHCPLILTEYRTLKKEETKSASQSCTNHIRFMSQCTSSL
jgi:hypothetical protein